MEMMDCITGQNRKWFLFVACDFAVYFGGLFIIIVWRLLKYLCCRRSKQDLIETENIIYHSQMELENVKDEYLFMVAFRYYISHLISTQYFVGRILLLISTICSMISVILYMYELLRLNVPLERCQPLSNPIYCIDLGFNTLFLLHFILRLSGSFEKISFWLNFYSFVDMFTIPQILFSLIINREWIGLRFLRVAALNRLPMVLQSFGLIQSATLSRIAQLVTLFITILIGGAGFFHLFENSGEITTLRNYTNNQDISYGDSIYFIVVTLSTVGYGDFSPKTIFGKIFVVIFILLALAIFASFIPELAEFLFSQSQYLGSYQKEGGVKHVVVCGNITFASVETFLADFFHEDRSNKDIEVVFINKKDPDSMLKTLLKTYFVRVKYFQGTVMDQSDLKRVQMLNADACLILANQDCSDPADEDSANIMRAISVKNYCPTSPVIIQILQFENKVYLENIPDWTCSKGDQIICYSEIELGILAQSCLVPGFSTLLTNIFSVRSDKDLQRIGHMNSEWIHNYLRGVSMEIYSSKFSDSLLQKPYHQIVEICFKHLNLLLIAVEYQDPGTRRRVLKINPLQLSQLPSDSIGYFICDSHKDARNASIFCTNCHSALRDLKLLRKCHCDTYIKSNSISAININENRLVDFMDTKKVIKIPKAINYIDSSGTNDIEIAGSYYQCKPLDINKCQILTKVESEQLKDHIILTIFPNDKFSSIGLRSFMAPLRSTALPQNKLKTVLIIAQKEFLVNEWAEISTFPKLKVIFFERSIRKIIDLLHIETCCRCVIVNSDIVNDEMKEGNDLYMLDKEVIITNLYLQNESRKRLLKKAGLYSTFRHSTQEKLNESVSFINRTKSTVFVEMKNSSSANTLDNDNLNNLSNVHVQVISKLAVESNVQFLDNNKNNSMDKSYYNLPNYLRQPFAFGSVFTASMLDSLVSTAYFSQNAIKIMEMLINGGCLDEDCTNDDYYESEDEQPLETESEKCINKFHIELIKVVNFKKTLLWENNVCYRDFFIEVLINYGLLCLGVYRKINFNLSQEQLKDCVDRYVVTNPPSTFVMDKTDMAYCIVNDCQNSQVLQKSAQARKSFLLENIDDVNLKLTKAPIMQTQNI